jgi:hypothetical protein
VRFPKILGVPALEVLVRKLRLPAAVPTKRSPWNPLRWLWRGAGGLLVAGALVAAAFYLFAVRPDRQSAPYRRAMERLRANRSAARLLGTPVEAGWWVRGHAGADSARLAVPVSGPTGREGVLRAEAGKAGGTWVFSALTLTVADNNVRLSLLEKERRREKQGRGDAPALEVPPRYKE